jgi:sulfur carrier protein ThiS adenylyltransferase
MDETRKRTERLEGELFARNVPGMTEILGAATVAVAGCGGLGSNAAVSLVRAGVGKMILVDHDAVEPSNLNRQQFFASDVGRPKVFALANHLLTIHPNVVLELHEKRLAPEDVPLLFAGADLLIEAFDFADAKKWLIEAWCRAFPERPVVCGSGLAGLGGTERLKVRRVGQIVLCGDETSDMAEGLCAPRVAIVANMQANVAVELLVNRRDGELGRSCPSKLAAAGTTRSSSVGEG